MGGCGLLVPSPGRGRCSACEAPQRRARSSGLWKARSQAVRAVGRCAGCGRELPPAQLRADHVTRLADGGELMGPVRALCLDCDRERRPSD